nr:hypothetical protein [Pirellulaceae bacterium]
MRILVGWDDIAEAELIDTFLNVDENTDAVLMDLGFPSESLAFELFETIRRRMPNAPVVGAWRPGEISQVAKFIKEAAFLTVQAQRAQIVAEKLREEVEAVRQLQEAVLPHDLPMPAGYRIVARYEPSQIRVF